MINITYNSIIIQDDVIVADKMEDVDIGDKIRLSEVR